MMEQEKKELEEQVAGVEERAVKILEERKDGESELERSKEQLE